MSLDTDEILVGANGTIHVAPVGSTMPTTPDATLSAPWVHLGYATEDGVRWRDAMSVNDRMGWQSFYPLRKIVESRSNTIAFDLVQWNRNTLGLALGAPTVTEPVAASGDFQIDPPSPETVDERAVVVSWSDGDRDYRLLYWRAVLVGDIETMLARSESATLPIELEALPYLANPVYRLLTNDAAFDPA